jgi:hypothetical protein
MKRYHKIIIDALWLVVWWFALYALMIIFNPNYKNIEHQQVMERLESIDHWLADISFACQQ